MDEIIVETTAGKIQGTMERRVFTFKGVPYGAYQGKEGNKRGSYVQGAVLTRNRRLFPDNRPFRSTDITFENYCYYINLMRQVGGLEKLSFH